jgi:starch synthase
MEIAVKNLKVQIIILGTGDRNFKELIDNLRKKYPTNVGIKLEFNPVLPRLLFAGSDIFLMPSRYEPCGITQMEAMRYGTIPVVRSTGGLADTVQDYNPEDGSGYGFVFKEYDPIALYTQIVRATETYKNKKAWKNIQKKVMKLDFTWKASAKEYIELYEKAIELHDQETAPNRKSVEF